MQRVYRRRYPTCLTSLVSDVSPDPGAVECVDEEEEEEGGSSSCSVRACGLCLVNGARYTCPRCNVPYCTLSCYRGSAHTACSEQFYSECVREELRSRGQTERDGRSSMVEILLRLRERAEEAGGNAEGVTLLSRLAQAQEEGREEEAEQILHALRQIHSDEEEEEEEEEEEDLETKLSGLNIESLTEDDLWALLPQKEKQRFEELLKGGGIGAVVPVWRPWWEEHEPDTNALVQEVREELQGGADGGRTEVTAGAGRSSDVPPIDCRIPALGSLCSSPSPSVSFTLLSALYSYTFSLQMFNGDLSEPQQLDDFVSVVLSVSASLGNTRTFRTFSEAVAAATEAASQHSHAHRPDATLRGVAHVLSGRSRSDPAGYTLSALSHLRSAFGGVRRATPTQQEPLRRACYLAGKKCQFLQAWARENAGALRGLAREAWRESERMRERRERMDREKKEVEEGWRRGRGKEEKVLIQET